MWFQREKADFSIDIRLGGYLVLIISIIIEQLASNSTEKLFCSYKIQRASSGGIGSLSFESN